MNMFYRRGMIEYRRQISLTRSFARQTERLGKIIESFERKGSPASSLPAEKNHLRFAASLLLIAPLIEIAWADGRVTRRESDTILEVAACYGLIDDQAKYCELLERLTSRPAPQMIGQIWRDLRILFENLSEAERGEAEVCLLTQAHFVAEQSSDSLLNFLRGERIFQAERECLQIVSGQLEKVRAAAKEFDEKREAARAAQTDSVAARANDGGGDHGNAPEAKETRGDDYASLIPLVPLVKTAWAEGRVTKRERELIFEVAKNKGIKPGSPSHRRLSDWFELHPTDEFYDQSLEQLRGEFEKLPEEERVLRHLDLLSDCVNVAEASGGTSRFPAGGARICDEESYVVKNIARKLSGAATL